MKVILVYDITTETPEDKQRLPKILKVTRKYLTHVQKSVFEGELTFAQVERLKAEILGVVDKEKDSVIVYTLPDGVKLKRKILTYVEDKRDNII